MLQTKQLEQYGCGVPVGIPKRNVFKHSARGGRLFGPKRYLWNPVRRQESHEVSYTPLTMTATGDATGSGVNLDAASMFGLVTMSRNCKGNLVLPIWVSFVYLCALLRLVQYDFVKALFILYLYCYIY